MPLKSGNYTIRSADNFELVVHERHGRGNNQLKLMPDTSPKEGITWRVTIGGGGVARIALAADVNRVRKDEALQVHVKLDEPEPDPREHEWVIEEGPKGVCSIQRRASGKYVSADPSGLKPLEGETLKPGGKGTSLWLVPKRVERMVMRWSFDASAYE